MLLALVSNACAGYAQDSSKWQDLKAPINLLWCNDMGRNGFYDQKTIGATMGSVAEAIGVEGTALVGRRAPIVAALSNVVRRRTVTPTGSGKEDRFAVLAGYFVAVVTTLCRPCPCAFVYEFLHLRFARQAPTATPLVAGYIVGGVTSDVTHALAVGLAIVFVVARLGGCFTPGVVIAIVGGGGGADIACRPLHAQTEIYVIVTIACAAHILCRQHK